MTPSSSVNGNALTMKLGREGGLLELSLFFCKFM